MPWSPWGPCGELLLDLNSDADSAVRFLTRRMAQLPWQLVRIGICNSIVNGAFVAVFERLNLQSKGHHCRKTTRGNYRAFANSP